MSLTKSSDRKQPARADFLGSARPDALPGAGNAAHRNAESRQRGVFLDDRPVVRVLFFVPLRPVDEAAARLFVPPAFFFAPALALVLVPALALVLALDLTPVFAPALTVVLELPCLAAVFVPVFDALPARVLAMLVFAEVFVARAGRAAVAFVAAEPRLDVEAAEAAFRAVVPRAELVRVAAADVRRAVLFPAAAFLAPLDAEVFSALFFAPLRPVLDAAARRFVAPPAALFALLDFEEARAVVPEVRPVATRAELAFRAPDDARPGAVRFGDEALREPPVFVEDVLETNLKKRLVLPPSMSS